MERVASVEEQLYTVYKFWVVKCDGNRAEHMQTCRVGL